MSRFQEGPSVRLDLLVQKEDLLRARALLHVTMQLFPERETDDTEYKMEADDEVFVQAAVCDALADAESISAMLQTVGIWSRVHRAADDEGEGIVSYQVEVKGRDIERTMPVVEQWEPN